MKLETRARASTGVTGLDEILDGGLPSEEIYIVKGAPGTGKTTLALQFLIEGARRGEPAAYISLSETEKNIRRSARSHGWSLDGIAIHELGSIGHDLVRQEQYTLFHPAEVELAELTRKILATASGMKAPRVIVDSLSELRLLSGDPLRYRRQILALAQSFSAQQATVLLLDEGSVEGRADLQVESLAHGVIRIEQCWPELGDARRRLRVIKLRGVRFRGGYHDLTIETGGIVIYPRLRGGDHRADFAHETVSSGVPGLDDLLGGLDRGSTALIMGPTGSGKSALATQLAVAAADRGEHVALFVFDEVLDAVLARSDGLRMGLSEHVRSGRIAIRQIDPAELAPWQFARAVLQAVDRDNARMVVIDSINGYLNSMPDERALDIALHELFGCMSQLGVITVSTLVQHGFLGERAASALDISYLSDTVVLLSLFEDSGEMRRSISVVKRRRGAHKQTIHAFHIGPIGLRVGEPLRPSRSVLNGLPAYLGGEGNLRKDDGLEDG